MRNPVQEKKNGTLVGNHAPVRAGPDLGRGKNVMADFIHGLRVFFHRIMKTEDLSSHASS